MAARETGVVRQRLGGDTAAAQRLNGIARTQLGILKELMAFGNLQQLSRTVRLGDGTEIFVQSVFGQDSVRITPPVAAVEVAGEEEVQIGGGPYALIAGMVRLGSIYNLVIWGVSANGGGLLSYERLGIESYDPSSFPVMTDDGSSLLIAVRNRYNTTGNIYQWTPVGGVIDTGIEDYSTGGIYGMVTADDLLTCAAFVVGPDQLYYLWRWTAAGGAQKLQPDTAYDKRFAPSQPCMSSDGQTIYFYASVPPSGTGPDLYKWGTASGIVRLNMGTADEVVYGGTPACSSDGNIVLFLRYNKVTTAYTLCYSTGGSATQISSNLTGQPIFYVLSNDGTTAAYANWDSALHKYKIYRVGIGSSPVYPGHTSTDGALRINADGAVLFFSGVNSHGRNTIYRWADTIEDLGFDSHASCRFEPSSDFSVLLVTWWDDYLRAHVSRWNGTATDLGTFGGALTFGMAISPDGVIMAGDADFEDTHTSCAWTPNERLALRQVTATGSRKAITKVFYE